MKVADFDYNLPESLIAQTPMEPRDHSRLMVVRRFGATLEHKRFDNILDYLKPRDVLVLNTTRVLPARLVGRRQGTGGRIELLLLHAVGEDKWDVLVKPGRRAKEGTIIQFGDLLQAEVLERTDAGGRIVQFTYSGDFGKVLDKLGETPLPPYITEKLDDGERYQTVYSKESGSVAAPTAGLHFTEDLLSAIRSMGVQIVPLTLHVGLGTFRPVQVDDIEDHTMHAEFYALSPESAGIINECHQHGGRVFAVGTTTVRTLETLTNESGIVQPGSGWTDIFIFPGYEYKVVDALITNFHLPRSSLMMLVSAFAGRETIMQAYDVAINEQYRFFSFGDAMLLI